MAPNSLSPASVIIDYTTAYGTHKMTIPTKDWNAVPVSGALGSYEAWDLSIRDGQLMVEELVSKLLKFALVSTTFDQATVYRQATPTSPNIPQATLALGLTGLSGAASPSAAFSVSWMFKTLGNHDAKLVQLDIPTGSNWLASILPAGFTADMLALEAAFTAPTNAWSGRDDTRPAILRKATFDVNDALQRRYFG